MHLPVWKFDVFFRHLVGLQPNRFDPLKLQNLVLYSINFTIRFSKCSVKYDIRNMYYSRNPTPFSRASVSNLCIIMCRNLEIIARENRRVIKNGQSRDTDNIGHTRYRTKTNKTQKYNTTQHRKLKGWTNGTPPIIRRNCFGCHNTELRT